MEFFIDESGPFVPTFPNHSPSVVGGLVVPSIFAAKLYRRYARLRQSLPKSKGEVKGRNLSCAQVVEVIDLLAQNQCLFEAVIIDTGAEPVNGLLDHQSRQADALVKHLTDQHHADLVAGFKEQQAALRAMTPQLYLQSVANFVLIEQLLRWATFYYVQRFPAELRRLSWVVDAKSEIGPTAWEKWWGHWLQPALQSKFLVEPLGLIPGANYRFMNESFLRRKSDHEAALPGSTDDPYALDAKGMTGEIRFSAGSEPGLELVDILTNATRRSLLGHLEDEAAHDIHRLMLERGEQCITLIQLTKEGIDGREVRYRQRLLRFFARGGRPALTSTTRRWIDEVDERGASG